jgi:hypothetical protein
MRCLSSILASVLSAGSLCGCGSIFYAQLEEPELCKTMPAAFSPSAPGTTSQRVSVDFDLRSDLERFTHPDATSNLQLKYVQFTATQGTSDFGFVDSAKVTIQAAAGNASCNLPALVDYQRDPSAPAQSPQTFAGSSDVDLMPCLSTSAVSVQTDFSGRLPSNAWSMNVKACFSGKARINYLSGK